MQLTLRTSGGFAFRRPGVGRECEARPDGQTYNRPTATSESLSNHPRRILAMCLGGIGDTVLAFAALRDLRRLCPHDHLTALAMWPQSAELLSDLGIFDEVLCHNFQRDRLWRSLFYTLRLRLRHFDGSFLAFPSNRFEYNVLSFLIGGKRRLGHEYIQGGRIAGLRFLLSDRIVQRPDGHTVDENRALIRVLAGRPFDEPADIRLGPIDPRHHSEAGRLLGHLQRPLVGIHAGCSTYKGHAAKRWPAERFGELCRFIIDRLGFQPVVFGMPDEYSLKLEVQRSCPEVFMAHGDSIRLTAAMIARCSAFVSNDSSLAHLASALDVPVIMICGPTPASMVVPRSGKGTVVASKLPCAPCFQIGRKPLTCTHRIYQACLQSITVEEVFNAVTERLGRGEVRSNASSVVSLPVLQTVN